MATRSGEYVPAHSHTVYSNGKPFAVQFYVMLCRRCALEGMRWKQSHYEFLKHFLT